MKFNPEVLEVVSVISFGCGLGMFFYFIAGWDLAPDGFGPFWFLGFPSVGMVFMGFFTQFAAIRGFKSQSNQGK